jgi:hypothetical protein
MIQDLLRAAAAELEAGGNPLAAEWLDVHDATAQSGRPCARPSTEVLEGVRANMARRES